VADISDPANTAALHDVIAERRRQVSEEGWDAAHDDEHAKGELGRAALNYLAAACIATLLGGKSYEGTPPLHRWGGALGWPWHWSWWKPGIVRRMLVKAAALILAEIERLDRAAAREASNG